MQAKPQLLTTARLTLRAFAPQDLPQADAILRAPEVSRTYMLPDFEGDAQVQRLFDRMALLSRAEDRLVYAIDLDGLLIGFLNDVGSSGDTIELGYALHPAYWGHGYAAEALAAAIQAAFAMGFSCVRAGHFAENPASARVMEKCGMTPIPFTEALEYRGAVHTCLYREIRR